MKNKENSVYVVIALVLISVVASGLLGITNEVTAPVIAMRNKVASDQLRKGVLPIASEFKEMPASKYKGIGGGILKEVYEGEKDGKVAGYTFKVTPSGYGGEIEVMVGITKEGKISGVDMGNMTETAGLGMKAKDEPFKGQYKNKAAKPLEVVKGTVNGDNQILAISGATITSRAVTNGVNVAIEAFDKLNK